ncbi:MULTISPECIES: hypothetical protein [Paenibacillus]|uniref:hypothetical protein n=1 Tax=Paenibacillus TaxID=44249 RepID=UPI0012B983B6|nr:MULTISPECIES: hypothetical protein [Paenibacillus]
MVTKVIYSFILSTVILFSIVGCTTETSATQEMAQTLMKEDKNSDLFLIESILYKKVKSVNETEFKSVNTTPYGQISMNYKKNEKFQSGMASVLPPGTKLYRSIEHPEYVYSSEENGYTMYQSVPEG